jgi:hypothetical protein
MRKRVFIGIYEHGHRGSNVQLVLGEKIQLISKSKMGAERRARPLKMSAHGVKCYIV